MNADFTLKDETQLWYEWILEYHADDPVSKVAALLEDAVEDENGCLVTNTKEPKWVRYQGGRDRAYRFILYIKSNYAPPSDEVVRHGCHNRLCINPDHLQIGSRLENWIDKVDRRVSSVGFHLLDLSA